MGSTVQVLRGAATYTNELLIYCYIFLRDIFRMNKRVIVVRGHNGAVNSLKKRQLRSRYNRVVSQFVRSRRSSRGVRTSTYKRGVESFVSIRTLSTYISIFRNVQ